MFLVRGLFLYGRLPCLSSLCWPPRWHCLMMWCPRPALAVGQGLLCSVVVTAPPGQGLVPSCWSRSPESSCKLCVRSVGPECSHWKSSCCVLLPRRCLPGRVFSDISCHLLCLLSKCTVGTALGPTSAVGIPVSSSDFSPASLYACPQRLLLLAPDLPQLGEHQ